MEPPTTPPAQPPGSPLLTGLIIGLLLIALSVAVFQLLGPDDTGVVAAGDTTTTSPENGTTTTGGNGTTTTTGESTPPTTAPVAAPYPPVNPPIPVEDMKLITNGIRGNDDDDIPDILFGTDAETAIGRLVASLGDPTEDTGWQTSTNGFGVCAGELERIVFFGTFAAIVTKPGGQEIFNGYRQDLVSGDLAHPAAGIETLSGLRIGDTVAQLLEIYADQKVSFVLDPKLDTVYLVESAATGDLLLWGPVEGEDPTDRVIGIFAPDVCNR